MRAVRSGDEIAWTRLVNRFERGLRNIARTYRLGPSDIDDVMQATWLRLFKHVTTLRDPNAIAGWLATTTRRECLRKLQHPVREYPTDDPRLGDRAEFVEPEDQLVAADRHAVLMRALESLPKRQRQLMTALTEPNATYQSVSRTLGMPVGSIGPIRARSLARLEHNSDLQSLRSSAG
jgi:RNA polymerase sigma factor (sigma-70 family)